MGNIKKYYIIYETKNLKNKKIYIGMHETNNLEDGYLGSGKRLKRAIRYYGREHFERKILYIFNNKEDMIAKEIELVNEEFVLRKDNYNLKPGGEGGWEHINSNKEKLKALAKKLNEKIWNNPEHIKKHKERQSKLAKKMYREGRYPQLDWSGKLHSEDTKKKIGNKSAIHQKGSGNSQYGKIWIYNIELKQSIKISKDSLPEYLSNGWIRGRKIKFN